MDPRAHQGGDSTDSMGRTGHRVPQGGDSTGSMDRTGLPVPQGGGSWDSRARLVLRAGKHLAGALQSLRTVHWKRRRQRLGVHCRESTATAYTEHTSAMSLRTGYPRDSIAFQRVVPTVCTPSTAPGQSCSSSYDGIRTECCILVGHRSLACLPVRRRWMRRGLHRWWADSCCW